MRITERRRQRFIAERVGKIGVDCRLLGDQDAFVHNGRHFSKRVDGKVRRRIEFVRSAVQGVERVRDIELFEKHPDPRGAGLRRMVQREFLRRHDFPLATLEQALAMTTTVLPPHPTLLPAGALEVTLREEQCVLLAGGLLWRPFASEGSTVLAADTHFGKDATFRSLGIAVPSGPDGETLARLTRALQDTKARRLVILGDFFHARAGLTESTLAALRAWRLTHADIDLVLDRSTRKIIAKKARNLVVDPGGAKDAALTALVDRYSKLSAPLENRIVGKLTREVNGVISPSGESSLGNLIADAHLFGTTAPDKGGAVIAFNNPGSLRAPIIPDADGGVKYGDLFKSQPFQNDLIIMTFTGKQLKNMLEQQFMFYDRPRMLGVSKGFSYTWDNAKPRGEKIVSGSMKLNGVQINPALQYRVAANSFLASGIEGMSVFRDGTDRQVGVLDLDALVEMISAGSPFTPAPVGRLIRLN